MVLSGFGATQMSERALAVGADGYLQKGVPLRTILDYVRDVTSDDAPHPPRALTVVPEQPPQRAEQLPPPPPADSARLAPFGIVEIANESLYRVISANDAANELLGRPCRPGTPLYATAPALASLVVVHGDHDSDTFEVDQLDRRLSAMIRSGGESLFVYLQQVDDEQDLQRRVATAAHELRNPASVIQGLVDALLAGGADLDEAERSRLLDAIAQQADLLGTVAGDLLVPAQAQHGNLRIEAAPVDPAPVLRSEGELLDDVAVEVDDERSVLADARRLEQMVHNLVSNARKYGAAAVHAPGTRRRGPGVRVARRRRPGSGRARGLPRPDVRRVHPRRGHRRSRASVSACTSCRFWRRRRGELSSTRTIPTAARCSP